MHNLKDISLALPHNQLTVVTGVSGSGKSTLVFDTVYAEGQRRYVESLSAYARQFLDRMEKPEVDEILGLAPPIAIRQKNTTRNPRSTVATSTEVYDFLRLLFARAGTTYCSSCGEVVRKDTVDVVAETMAAEAAGMGAAALAERAGVAGPEAAQPARMARPMRERTVRFKAMWVCLQVGGLPDAGGDKKGRRHRQPSLSQCEAAGRAPVCRTSARRITRDRPRAGSRS